MNRRAYLALLGSTATTGTAGCLTSRKHERDDDAWDIDDRTRREGKLSLNGSLTLEPGRYATREIETEMHMDFEIEFEVDGAYPIDVYFMYAEEYERYVERNDMAHFASLSETESDGRTLRGPVKPGAYRFVVDNTRAFSAKPDKTVEVSVAVEAEASEPR